MSSSNDSRIYKILVAVLLFIIIALGYWSFSTFNKNEEIMDGLTNENVAYENDLKALSDDYALELEKGTLMSNELEDAKERIDRLIDSVSGLEASVALMSKLRKELSRFKVEKRELQEQIAVLKNENELLLAKNDSTLQVLNSEVMKSIKKTDQINVLNDNITKAAVLLPVSFSTTSYIVRSSGKQIENDRASRVDALNTCFTLPYNTLSDKGVQTFYVQIINPENNVIGTRAKIQFNEQELMYSKKIEVNYQGEELKICEMVDLIKEYRESGSYRVNLYRDGVRIAGEQIELR